jgi:hypothetical protein
MKKKLFILVFSILSVCYSYAQVDNSYNLVWQTPSKNSLGSMPLSGNHGAGANVWVESGSIWIYLAHNGAYDEHGRLLKLGCLRITPQNIHLGDQSFKQILDLPSGTIIIKQNNFKVSLWFSDETLVIESQSIEPGTLKIAFGSWRYKFLNKVRINVWNSWGSFSPDNITMNNGGLLWFHNNAKYKYNVDSLGIAQGISIKDIDAFTAKRISGGSLAIKGGLKDLSTSIVRWQYWDGKAWEGISHRATKQVIAIRLGSAVNANIQQWQVEARDLLLQKNREKAKRQELKKWKDFWSRSYVLIDSKSNEHDNGFLIGRNYQLFRYMLACNRNGEFPLLFNGGIFTVDNKPGTITGNNDPELRIAEGDSITPDFRRWESCHFMSQNQRWLGWPTIASGDNDLLVPSLRFYKDRERVASERAQHNGALGVVYTEPLDIWGLCCVGPLPNGLCGAKHLTYHFSMMLEHAWMALQAHDALNTDISKDLSWIIGTVKFYDTYYRARQMSISGHELNAENKLVIYPGNELEFAGGATNPIEVVCALKRIVGALQCLPELSEKDRLEMKRIYPTIPDLPIGIREGKKSLLPANSWEKEYNKWELGEMYAAWPYRMVGVTNPGTLQLARDTWNTIPKNRARLCKQDFSWQANVVNMAALALPEEAEKRAIYKMANITAPQARFPAFFGPGHDWLPDHNWGGSGMVGIQEMLISANPYGDGKIYLLYAWPKKWNVHFKLHAPQNTIVEANVCNGKVMKLNVIPSKRLKDVVINPQFK